MKSIQEETKDICLLKGIKPQRSKGQNFLIKEKVYHDIIESAKINNNDIVLEAGPGLGYLTEMLSHEAKKVYTIELDKNLIPILHNKFKANNIKNIEIINENVMDVIVQKEKIVEDEKYLNIINIDSDYKIVANLPYNITSVFLRKFLTSEHKPASMVLMLQKEVAERIVAKSPKMSLLAFSVQFYAKAEIIRDVSRDFFYPVPRVDSSIIKIDLFRKKDLPVHNEKKLFRLVRFGFSQKRKMLKNNLASGLQKKQDEILKIIKKAGFSEKIRAQELSVEDWLKLYKVIEKLL